MSTVRFRYGFHPEGFDPLLALRATQPVTIQVPAAAPRQALTVPRTIPACPPAIPQVVPRRIVRQERPRGRGWGKFLWASLVLLSAGVAGTVWASGQSLTTPEADTPVLAFAEPTIIEPEMVPIDQSNDVTIKDVPRSVPLMQQPVASYPAPSAPQKSSPSVPSTPVPSSVPPTTEPSTSEPSQPSVSQVPPALPSVTLPPAVVWTPAPVSEKPNEPTTSTPETPVQRPTVVVRPEAKPSLRVPPAAQPRSPVSQPKARTASPITAGKMTRATK